ncbi:hypothetical protein AGABI2DRAFT_211033 [Agaricus bisporus var. bisporus H97]|uniref:hypothetical protein n=1 Tax=Agaricus bisporus var. bisporus (strain H97 / ATCC MYA-4626 / FGSC 10389) TaxID=936046 RepID=UPI00029F6E12|nr:hypothetical protein AGABI2DRAFT_211033 [Agaricus bisporus var. bisporus H97]EKV43202.1 hypothetical protein AGABI2DRAFT_211033 [Agaricus bisporus var. bisporus H97]
MSPDPKCTAIANALKNSGLSYGQLANQVGVTEQRVIDICTGNAKPTDVEFSSLGKALGLTDVPHTGTHATT